MGGKDDDSAADLIATQIERLARLMRAEEHAEGLNPAQWEALRYLARANRFSNSPGALTRYLGATKGTVSQTVKALERKGFLAKAEREGEKRSVILALTPKAEAVLASDPWLRLAAAVDELGAKTRRRLAKAVRELMAAEVRRGLHGSFGQCRSCRFFREKARDQDPRGPHFCMLFEEPLSVAETHLICVAHQEG